MIWELFCYAFVFFAEGITAWSYFDHVFPRSSKRSRVIFSFAVVYLVLFLLSQFKNITINGLSFLVLNGILLFLNYSCKVVAGLIHIGYLSFVMAASEIFLALLLIPLSHDFAAYTYDLSVMIAFSVLSRLLFFSVMQISGHLFKPIQTISKDINTVLLLSVLPLGSVIVALTVIYIGMTVDIPKFTGILMTVSVLALLMMNILVVIIYNHIQKINEERLELELQVQKEKADAQYYHLLQEQYDSHRIWLHDMNKHIMSIESLLADNQYDELSKYINTIHKNTQSAMNVRLCSEPILNIVLVRYAQKCRELGVVYHFDVRDCKLSYIDPYDQTALFDNLFSNAMEAVVSSTDKSIEFTIEKRSEGVFLSLVNSCDITPAVSSDGRLVSSKSDKNNHGVGLKSIYRVVNKYNGYSTFYFDQNERKFHSIVFLAALS